MVFGISSGGFCEALGELRAGAKWIASLVSFYSASANWIMYDCKPLYYLHCLATRFLSLQSRCARSCFLTNELFLSPAVLFITTRAALSLCFRERNYSFWFTKKTLYIERSVVFVIPQFMPRWFTRFLEKLYVCNNKAILLRQRLKEQEGNRRFTMVKHGQKPVKKAGISIQNTNTLTRGQMKIRVFTGLASSLHSVHRKKVRYMSKPFFYSRRNLLINWKATRNIII